MKTTIISILLATFLILGCSAEETTTESIANESITKTISPQDPVTKKQLPTAHITIPKEEQNVIEIRLITMPSVKDFLIEQGATNHPGMRVIGPFYQISPQGTHFNGTIHFSFCYNEEDIDNYDESLFYIAEEYGGDWKKIGGTPNPEKKCVDINLTKSPKYSFAIYAGLE